MASRHSTRVCQWAWCLAGFLFSAAIMAIGLAFGRQHVPTEAELAAVAVHPDVLSGWINGLAIGHLVAGVHVMAYWHDQWAVLLITPVQIGCTLYAWFLAGIAVQGLWL
jgi:hypothetical protein